MSSFTAKQYIRKESLPARVWVEDTIACLCVFMLPAVAAIIAVAFGA